MSDEWWMINDDPDAVTPGHNKSSSPSSEVKHCGKTWPVQNKARTLSYLRLTMFS